LLNERIDLKQANPTVDFEPILIVINDIQPFCEMASEDTLSRMGAIINLAGNLNVYILVSGDPEAIATLNRSNKFAIGMVNKSSTILLGGSFKSHRLYTSKMTYSESEQPLPEGEGYMRTREDVIRFKAVSSEV
jgi:hypothetical protein